MTNILLLSLITSLFIFGWQYATTYMANNSFDNTQQPIKRVEKKPVDYEVLGLLRWYVRCILIKLFPNKVDYIMKPLFGCPVCMASVYGTCFYWAYFVNSHQSLNFKSFLFWAVAIVVTSGINRIIKSFLDK